MIERSIDESVFLISVGGIVDCNVDESSEVGGIHFGTASFCI